MTKQPPLQVSIPLLRLRILDRNPQRFLGPDHHHQVLSPGDPGIDQIRFGPEGVRGAVVRLCL